MYRPPLTNQQTVSGIFLGTKYDQCNKYMDTLNQHDVCLWTTYVRQLKPITLIYERVVGTASIFIVWLARTHDAEYQPAFAIHILWTEIHREQERQTGTETAGNRA